MRITEILKRAGFPQDYVVLDFESYYDTEYSLTKMSAWEYVTDKRFEALGCGLYWVLKSGVKRNEFVYPEKLQANFSAMNQQWGDEFNRLTVVIQNAKFDALVLQEKYGITPKYIIDIKHLDAHQDSKRSHKLKDMAMLYGVREKGRTEDFKGLRWADMSIEKRQELATYCKNDCESEQGIFEQLLPRLSWPDMELWFANHSTRLWLCPKLVFNKSLARQLYTEMTEELDRIVERTGFSKKQISGNKSIVKLFTSILPEKDALPMKQGKSELIPALAKNDDGCNYLLAHPDPRVANLMEARLAVKSWPNHLKRMLTMGSMAKAAGGLMPVPHTYYGAHCVTGDHEVLTADGWVKLSTWNGGKIVQWSEDGLVFDEAAPNAFPVVDENMVVINAPYYKLKCTPGHTMPAYKFGGSELMPCRAEEFYLHALSTVPIAGVYAGLSSLTEDQIRLLVAIQADGHWQLETCFGRELRFGLTKRRKQDRLEMLFNVTGVPFRVQEFPSHPGEKTYRVRWSDRPEWLDPAKKFFGPWVLDLSAACKKAFIDELQYWDGHFSGNQEYYSKEKVNHDWVHVVAHTIGLGASRVKTGTTTIRQTRNPGFTGIKKAHMRRKKFSGTVYCPTTQTGYWMYRYKGFIGVTGNTGRSQGGEKINLNNLGGAGRAGSGNHPLITKMRGLLMAPAEYTMVLVDSAQIEARVLVWLAGCAKLVKGFANNEDIYSDFATTLFGSEVRKPRKDDSKELAFDLTIKRGFGKDAILGSGYGMGSNKFYSRCLENKSLRPLFDNKTYTFSFVDQLISTYRSMYKEVPNFWRTIEGKFRYVVQNPDNEVGYGKLELGLEKDLLRFWNDNGTVNIQLPSSRILFYPHAAYSVKSVGKELRYEHGHLWGGTLTENVVQAIARDLLVTWIRNVELEGIPVVHHVYDEIIGMVPIEEAGEAQKTIEEIMCTVPDWAEGLPLAAEGKTSVLYVK